ncbi:MAG: TolC family protein [Desulfobacteraceae bacterium]|nr:TolC family protein [Desulfobacteraceae bacterium]
MPTKPLRSGKIMPFLCLLVINLILFSSWMSGTLMASELKELPMNDAIHIALENNNDLKLEGNNLKSLEVATQREKGRFYPDLKVESSGSVIGESNSSSVGSTENKTLDMNITSRYNVFNGFQDSASLKKAGFELNAGHQTYSRASQEVIFNTVTAYIEAVSAQALIVAKEENLKDNQKQLEQIKAFYESGTRAVVDLYKQQAETKAAEQSLLSAKNSFAISKLNLLQAMGIKAGYKFGVRLDQKVDFTAKNYSDYKYEDLLNKAVANRPDLKSSETLLHAADEGIRAAKAGYSPSVDIYAQVGSDYNSSDDLGLKSQLINDGFDSAVGLTISIPIFDKSVTKTNIADAVNTKEKRRIEQKSLTQQIGINIGQALEDYRTAVKQLEVTSSRLKYSKKTLESMVEKYAVGSSTLIELVDARSDFAQAGYDNIKAVYDLLAEKVVLAYYQGDVAGMTSFSEVS